MNQVIIVGCDLHDRSLLLKAACGMGAPHQKSFLNDCQGRQAMLDFLLDFAQQHKADRIVFVYEASGQGYGLYDFLTDQGVECYVLSPSHLPKSAKQKRNKTDAKDAQMLLETARAYVMAGNELPMVWVPPTTLRNDRELVRARLETAEAGASVKLKILSLLKRHSRAIPEVYRNNPNWTKRFLRYLATESQQLPSVVGPVLLSLLARLEVIRKQVTELDRQLRKLSTTERYRVPCEALLKMNGVGLLTALTFLTEMGDLNRFPNRRTVGAYLGLTPAAKESGEASDRKGHITRQGGSRLRKMLCQAAWAAIRRDAAVRTTWERIRGNRPGRGKKAIVAIMRRLGIRMWHVALTAGVSGDLATRPIPPLVGWQHHQHIWIRPHEAATRSSRLRKRFSRHERGKRSREEQGPGVTSRAGGSPALAWLSLAGLLLSRARLRFTRPIHPTHFLCAKPEVKPVNGRQSQSAAVLYTVRGRSFHPGIRHELPAGRLARTTIHVLCRTRLSGIV